MTTHSTVQIEDPEGNVTRREFYEFKDYVYTSLDHMTEILERLDQERVFTNAALHRLEETDKNHEARISHLEKAIA